MNIHQSSHGLALEFGWPNQAQPPDSFVIMELLFCVTLARIGTRAAIRPICKVTKKKTVIHPSYLVWTQQLADQIKSNLAKGAEFSPVLAPLPKPENQKFKEPLSAFGQFKFEPTTLAPRFANEQSAIKSGTNLDHNIALASKPKLNSWNKPEIARTLLIKTHISDLRFIGTGKRLLTGVTAGRSNVTVEVTLVDQATAEVVGKTVLRRIAKQGNGLGGARNDYAMIENVGKDVVTYIDKNYAAVTGDLTPAELAQ